MILAGARRRPGTGALRLVFAVKGLVGILRTQDKLVSDEVPPSASRRG